MTHKVLLAVTMAAMMFTGAYAQQAIEPGSQGHVSLVLHDNWRSIPAEVQMEAQYQQSRRQPGTAYFHFYTESHPVYRARVTDNDWPASVPVVIQQDPDGRVVEQVATAKIRTWFPKRPWLSARPWVRPRPVCPGPNCPTPAPINVEVEVPQPVEPAVVYVPQPPEPEKPFPVIPVLLVAALAAFLYYKAEG